MIMATCVATPNIAFVKYWGKRDERLHLPVAGSVSMTLDETLASRTTVDFGGFPEDSFVLDGRKGEFPDVIGEIRERAGIARLKARIVSRNNFPPAAGLASSASGFAALVVAATDAAGLRLSGRDLSVLARKGSGSACRSVVGGFAEWRAGKRRDGSDSYAEQIAPARHWRGLVDLAIVLDGARKKMPSRAGMRQTVATSDLYGARVAGMAAKISECRRAIIERDAPALFALVMRESNNMHAVMLDTWPPISYMNDESRKAVCVIHELVNNGREPVCGYTFDAGPNPHIITTRRRTGGIIKALKEGGVKVRRALVCGAGDGPRIVRG